MVDLQLFLKLSWQCIFKGKCNNNFISRRHSEYVHHLKVAHHTGPYICRARNRCMQSFSNIAGLIVHAKKDHCSASGIENYFRIVPVGTYLHFFVPILDAVIILVYVYPQLCNLVICISNLFLGWDLDLQCNHKWANCLGHYFYHPKSSAFKCLLYQSSADRARGGVCSLQFLLQADVRYPPPTRDGGMIQQQDIHYS